MSSTTRNRNTGLALLAVVAAMVGLAFASVPLYRLFCSATGFGGTPQRVEASALPAAAIDGRVITVRFDSEVNPALPWTFQPVQREIKVRIGERALALYRATNHSDRPVTGQATFNVTPDKAGPYFDKIQCFCFTEQTLQAGQTVDMPVTFFIDPAILKDRSEDDVDTITLSYTFFRAADDAARAVEANGTHPAPSAVTAIPGTKG